MKNKLPIRLDEIYSHWKKLCFEEDVVAGEVADDYACLAEWHAIQVRTHLNFAIFFFYDFNFVNLIFDDFNFRVYCVGTVEKI
jgi:hypothetical protein